MLRCSDCGGPIDALDRFCRFCGARQKARLKKGEQNSSDPRTDAPTSRAIRRWGAVGLATLLALAALAAVWPRPSANRATGSTVLLDVQGRLVTDGTRNIHISPLLIAERPLASIHVVWSSSDPLLLEIGSFQIECEWLSMGGTDACGNFEPPLASGERTIRFDSTASGNVWFAWGDPLRDGNGTFVDRLTITGYMT